jgi:hypothetical protein
MAELSEAVDILIEEARAAEKKQGRGAEPTGSRR